MFWLWRPEHQVWLHTENFFHAIDGRNWETVADFIAGDYHDQWDNDRARLLERMREGFRWVRGSRITVATTRFVGGARLAVDESEPIVPKLVGYPTSWPR